MNQEQGILAALDLDTTSQLSQTNIVAKNNINLKSRRVASRT